jgi:DNA helicase-2/ATP-dependent DNA helicase PcrA
MPIDDILKKELTIEQQMAAVDQSNEILCLACAGSGKSRTLAYRIARLIAEGEPANSIVAFTFTEKAADTIKRRVSQALIKGGINPSIMGAMYIGTIHAFCRHILGEMDAVYRQFDILDENRLKLYMISRYTELGIAGLRDRARGNSYFDAIKKLSDAWKTINDEMLNINDIVQYDNELGVALKQLNTCLQRDQFIDFSLMIRKVVDALIRNENSARQAVKHLRHLMVDEYQDVSPSQEKLIRCLHNLSDTLFVVGDDDQSIYAWRGADVSNILEFSTRYNNTSTHTLSENFRSTSAIVGASDQFVKDELGASRIEKKPRAATDETPRDIRVLWFDNRKEEALWVANRIKELIGVTYKEADGSVRGLTPADFAILMRSTKEPENDELKTPRHTRYTDALKNLNILYSLEAGGGPFDRPQVSVLRSTLELLRNSSPSRQQAKEHFDLEVIQAYPDASFNAFAKLLTEWGRKIHTPLGGTRLGGTRRRVYMQQMLYDLLRAFGIYKSNFSDATMRDIGLFSRMIQDVEAVYMSVDSPSRFHEVLNFLRHPAETGYDVSTDDVLQRPDVVTVSTVHKAKGLEYPVVFVVDVEAQRFPGRRRSYTGWLPKPVIIDALNRGAYQKNDDEEARLFYTALTRAERYLYVTGSANLPGGKRARKMSKFANRLKHKEISTDSTQLPVGLSYSTPIRRIDETILPTNFSAIRYYLRCPMDYRFRQSYGFSPPIPDMFGFGKTVHATIEKLHKSFEETAPLPEDAEEIACRVFHLKHVPKSNDPQNKPGPYERAKKKTVEIARDYVQSYGRDFQCRRQVEARFEIPAKDSVISGSIDLLIKQDEQGRILEAEVIDFKAVEGGESPTYNDKLDWTELSLQVQLYAKAANEVLGENAKTGSVHLLKDNQRVDVPISDTAIEAAVHNIEWAVQGILAADYPMRPHPNKCTECDFRDLCSKIPRDFSFSKDRPPKIHIPEGKESVRAFSYFEPDNSSLPVD